MGSFRPKRSQQRYSLSCCQRLAARQLHAQTRWRSMLRGWRRMAYAGRILRQGIRLLSSLTTRSSIVCITWSRTFSRADTADADPMYRELGCLKDDTTDQYCFAQAVDGTSNDEMYWYLLGSGTSLPSGTKSDCAHCTASVLEIYSRYAGNTNLQISKTYPLAQTLATKSCGVTYAPMIA